MIPYGRQDVTEDDISAVVSVLRSDFLTQGPVVPRFEAAVAAKVQTSHGVASNSATSALHLAYAALGLGPGDVLWTQPTTFVASANAALYCGAEVDFVDIDPARLTMCPDMLERKLIEAESDGRLPKIVVPVHMCGQPADMAAINALAQRFGFHIVEDASHAIGARCGDRMIGAMPSTDATIFSFHPVKIVTSGEGGMAVTQNTALARRMELLRSHGITRSPDLMEQQEEGPWFYEQVALGWNYRMTDIAAALGLSQLDRLDDYIQRRNALATCYDNMLRDLPVDLPFRSDDTCSAFHLYAIRLHDAGRRKAVFEALRNDGIGVNVHYIPVHLQPFYRRLGFGEGQFPAAEAYYNSAISLPLFPTLGDSDQAAVVDSLRRALQT